MAQVYIQIKYISYVLQLEKMNMDQKHDVE